MSGLGGGPLVVEDREQVRQAFRVLGARLAAARKVVGLTQQQLSARVAYSRSSVANVETGRHEINRGFWERADSAVSARGALLTAFDKASAMSGRVRAMEELRRHAARQPTPLGNRVEVDARDDHDPASGAGPVTVGAVTLTVTSTNAGGVRIVIETGPPNFPGADVGSMGAGGVVIPVTGAFGGRGRGRPGRGRRLA